MHISLEDQHTYIRAFKNYDVDGNGNIDKTEFKNLMIDMGRRKITDGEVLDLIKNYDQDDDGEISWVEFIDMMESLKVSDSSAFGKINEAGQATVENKHGGKHTYSIEECQAFAQIINGMLAEDPDA